MTNTSLNWLTNKKVFLTLIVVWSVAMIALGYKVGIQHDYGYYLVHWELVREGLNPWTHNDSFPPNTYGPAYNALAYLAPIHQLLPKLAMLATFLIANVLLVVELFRRRPDVSQVLVYAFLIPLNFLVVSVVSLFGDNDTLVAALIAFAVLARFRNHLALAGMFLGLALLLKYYPALLIPFFCLNNRRMVWRPIIFAAATTAIGALIAWVIWGRDFLFSLSFGASREATYLSPLFALRNHPEFISEKIVTFLTNNDTVLVLLLAALTFAIAYRLRFTWLESGTVGLLVCLVAYKVGHAQYYIAWLVLLVALVIQGDRRSKYFVYAFLPLAALLELFQFSYFIRMNGYWNTNISIDQNIGFAVLMLAFVSVTFVAMSPTMRTVRADSGIVEERTD